MRFSCDGPDLPDDLLQARDDGRVIVVCGAGVSKGYANLPDFKSLTRRVLDNLHAASDSRERKVFDAIEKSETTAGVSGLVSYDRVFSYLEDSFPRPHIDRAVCQELAIDRSVAKRHRSKAHRVLVDFCTHQNGDTRLVTTNFDSLFYDAAPQLVRPTQSMLPSVDYNLGDWGVVHLHGRIHTDEDRPDKDGFILSTRDFGRAYLSQGWARQFIQKTIEKYEVLFVGYSADDPPVQYLLEGITASGVRHNGLYALTSNDSAEGLQKWRSKNVTPVTYRAADRQHSILWDTLAKWKRRSEDPRAWRSKVISRAKRGPRQETPSFRGQVCHLASTVEGANAIRTAPDPIHAEWVCVFDPAIRYGTPRKLGGPHTSSPEVDPLDYYRIDRDPDRDPPADGSLQPTAPEGVWSAFDVTRGDTRDAEPENFSHLIGYFGTHQPRLLNRFSSLADWIVSQAHHPAMPWWAGHRSSLSEYVLSEVRRRFANDNRKFNNTVTAAWQLIFESSSSSNSDREEHEVHWEIGHAGWTPRSIEAYERIARPSVKVQPSELSALPPVANAKYQIRDLVRAKMLFPRFLPHIPIPDEKLSVAVPSVRRGVEAALRHSQLFGSIDYIRDFVDAVASTEPQGSIASVNDYAVFFAKLFRRLGSWSSDLAQQEFATWDLSSPTFQRLAIWAAGEKPVVPDAQFVSVLDRVDSSVFWDFRTTRDLLTILAARWEDLSDVARLQVLERIADGPPHPKATRPDFDFQSFRARSSLERLYWLRDAGCVIPESFEFETKVGSRRLDAPDWSQDSAAAAADPVFEGARWVGTDDRFDDLLPVAPAALFTKIETLEPPSFRSYVERDPLKGLADRRPILLWAALRRASPSTNSQVAEGWRALLGNDARKTDSPRFLKAVCASVLVLSDDDLSAIYGAVADWMKKLAVRLSEDGVGYFGLVFDRLIEVAATDLDVGRTTVVSTTSSRDLATEALNSGLGSLTQALIKTASSACADQITPEWQTRANKLLSLPGERRVYPLVFFGFQLRWLFSVAEEWTASKVLGALEQPQSDLDAEAIWSGIFWSAQVPHAELFAKLKPHLLAELRSGRWEDDHGIEIAAGFLLAGWSARDDADRKLISNEEFREALLRGGDRVRQQVLWHLSRWAPADPKWSEHFEELFVAVWPKQRAALSPNTSAALCDFALALPDYFESLVHLIVPLISSTEDLDLVRLSVREKDLEVYDPEALLLLLWKVLPVDANRWPYGANQVVRALNELRSGPSGSPLMIELLSRIDRS